MPLLEAEPYVRHVVVREMRSEKKDAEICGAALLIAASGNILFIQKRNVMHLSG
jgi:hypothetical protein